jgi:hypothetical protein
MGRAAATPAPGAARVPSASATTWAGGTQHDRLSAAFGSLRPVANGATGLYDTALAAYKAVTPSCAEGKFNALVVLTDGVNQDPGSISRGRLISEPRKATDPERPLIMIGWARRRQGGGQRIAEATGGSGHCVSNPSQIQSVMLTAIVAAGTQSES